MKKYYLIALIVFGSIVKSHSQEYFIGEIKLFPFGFAPRGWALCNGQQLPISTNQALFSILGTTYGGNGVTTFALPDLRGRAIVGMGLNRILGQSGGTETVVLNASNLASHSHTEPIKVSTTAALRGTPIASDAIGVAKMTVGSETINVLGYNTSPINTALTGTPTTSAGNANPTAFFKLQPSLTLIYCIRLSGVFPSQN